MSRIVDFHSHLMPAVDDGARSVEQAIQALVAMGETPGLPTLLRGTEVMLDDPEVDLSDARIRSAIAISTRNSRCSPNRGQSVLYSRG